MCDVFVRGFLSTLWRVLLAFIITLGIVSLLNETGLVRAKNDEPEPNIQLSNPLTGPTMDESGKDTPTPGGNAETEKEPLISSTTTGAGEEFDGTRSLNRALTWLEKKLARAMRKVALKNGWNYAPLEDAEKIGPHTMTVVIKGKEAPSDLAGIYYRDKPLEEWERQLARTLLERAREHAIDEKK